MSSACYSPQRRYEWELSNELLQTDDRRRRSNRLISQLMQGFAEGMETVRFFLLTSNTSSTPVTKKRRNSFLSKRNLQDHTERERWIPLYLTKSPVFLSFEFSVNIAVAYMLLILFPTLRDQIIAMVTEAFSFTALAECCLILSRGKLMPNSVRHSLTLLLLFYQRKDRTVHVSVVCYTL